MHLQETYIPFDGSKTNSELWEMRTALPGYRSVMSVRHDEITCETATNHLRQGVFSTLGSLQGKEVLEIGTGVGRFTRDLEKSAKRVTSIDITRGMLQRARQLVSHDKTGLIQADAIKLPFPNSVFDLVFEVTVFMHIVDKENFQDALRESKRVLKPEGILFMCGHLSSDDVTRKIHAQLVHRSIDDYIDVIKPLKIVDLRFQECADELYTMMKVQ